MSDILHVNTLEQLQRFLNDDSLIEIAIRNKKKRFKTFQKIALDSVQNPEAKKQLNEAISILSDNKTQLHNRNNLMQNAAKLNKLSMVLNGLNICATCAGFAIMYSKLDKMSTQINEIVNTFKEAEGIHTEYEFKKTLSRHSDMLDCRKKQRYYSEEQMRELVADEHNVLELLIRVYESSVSNNRESLLFSILSLANMLSASLQFFDEVYYFNNREMTRDGEKWHMSHDEWVAVFDKLASPQFIESVQDLGMFDMSLTSEETDCLYRSFYDQVKGLRIEVEDNQLLIITIDDPAMMDAYSDRIKEETQEEIESALEKVGLSPSNYLKELRVAVA